MTSKRLQGLLQDLETKIRQRSPLFDTSQQAQKASPAKPNLPVPTSDSKLSWGFSDAPARRPTHIPELRQRVTPEDLARERSKDAEFDLLSSSREIYSLLLEVALHIARARNYARGVTQVSFFAPAEIVALALGIHRSTLYRHLPHLQKLGLIDAKGHRTTHKGQTLSDGTVWCVKLHPTRGKRARVRIEDLKHKWRDLSADIDAGRTAFEQVRQSKTQDTEARGAELLLEWALPRPVPETPLSMTVAHESLRGIESVLDVPYAPKSERSEMVDAAAKAVASYLGDDSINFYRWLLWQLLRLYDRGQDYFAALLPVIERAGADRREGFARSAGALFVSRLKRWEVWGLVRLTPPWAVGVSPH